MVSTRQKPPCINGLTPITKPTGATCSSSRSTSQSAMCSRQSATSLAKNSTQKLRALPKVVDDRVQALPLLDEARARTRYAWSNGRADQPAAASRGSIRCLRVFDSLLLAVDRHGPRAGSPEAELASMPTPGRRTAMRRSDRAVEVIARRTPWIVRGMARLAPATGRR